MDIHSGSNRQVARWLFIGVFMIVIQVLIGGITRLTESGLSITEWKPITGALPPLNHADWQIEFDKYRTTDQFKFVHSDFNLSDFKFIFFWEWMHRLWARLLGVVFLAGFIYFVVRRKLTRNMIAPMVLLFLLGALQGLIGWVMVESGLVPEKFYVGHIELTTHLIAALILLAYTLWFALQLYYEGYEKVYNKTLRNLLLFIISIFFIQLIYGGFMAGLKAAQTAPTWPDINGYFTPPGMDEGTSLIDIVVNNKLAIHFIHRGIAYILLALIIWFYIASKKLTAHSLFNKARVALMILTIAQVILGILTVTNATSSNALIVFGVLHQFTAMLIVINFVYLLYLLRRKRIAT